MSRSVNRQDFAAAAKAPGAKAPPSSDAMPCRTIRRGKERPRMDMKSFMETSYISAEQRDKLAPFHCAIPPVRSTQRIAHVSYGGRLLRCGISVRPIAD